MKKRVLKKDVGEKEVIGEVMKKDVMNERMIKKMIKIFIWILLVVVLIGLVLLGLKIYYSRQILMAPGDVVNVAFKEGGGGDKEITFDVEFGETGQVYFTKIPSSLPGSGPAPFIIENFGNVPADVYIVAKPLVVGGEPLLTHQDSKFQYRVHNYRLDEVEEGSGYEEAARDCFDENSIYFGCFDSFGYSDWRNVPFDRNWDGNFFEEIVGGLYSGEGIGEGYGDEFILEFRADVSPFESWEEKSTIIEIKGLESVEVWE